MFIIFNNIDVLEDHNIGLSVMFMEEDQLIANLGVTAPPHRIETRGVTEADTAISHSTGCSNGIQFVVLNETLSLYFSCFF